MLRAGGGGGRHMLFIPTLFDHVIISPISIVSHLALTHRVMSRHVIGGNSRDELRGLMSEPENLATDSAHEISVINWCNSPHRVPGSS